MNQVDKANKIITDFTDIYPRPGSVILSLIADLRAALKE